MPIKVVCMACEKELTSPGGILLSPPTPNGNTGVVSKMHLCSDCYEAVFNCILTINEEEVDRDKYDKDVGDEIEVELTNIEDFFKDFIEKGGK